MTAAVLTFADNFWGERNNGFDVLNANLKHGQESVRDMLEFLKESSGIEDATVKLLQKLSKTCGMNGSKGSFGPMWQQVKVLLERLASVHYQLVNGWTDLNKDIQRYADEQTKKHRAIRETESVTGELIQNMHQTAATAQKYKDIYHARCAECERAKKEGVSQKEYERVESKCRRAGDDYRAQVDKYNGIRVQFEARMTESCKKYQEAEEVHLKQMKDFVKIYASAWRLQRHLLEQVCDEFDSTVNELTIQKLIDKFVETKMTGRERPGVMMFEEYDASMAAVRATPDVEKSAIKSEKNADGVFNPVATPTESSVAAATNKQSMMSNRANISWFRRRPGRKDKTSKNSKENKDNDEMENGVGDDGKGKVKGPAVDSEGFSLPPPPSKEDIGAGSAYKVAYSSSDSDSDEESGASLSRLKVQIKPFNLLDMPIETDTTSDLKKSVGALRLSPTAIKRQTPTLELVKMKKSISISDTLSSDNSAQSSAAAKADSTTKELSGSLFEADYKPMINWGSAAPIVPAKTSTPWGPIDAPAFENKAEVKVTEGWASWDSPAPAAPSANSQQSWAVFDAPPAAAAVGSVNNSRAASAAFPDSGKSTPTAAVAAAGSPALPPKTRSRSPGLPAINQFPARSVDTWGAAPASTAKSVDTWGSGTVTRTGDTWGAVVTGVTVSSSVVTPRSITPLSSAPGAKLVTSSSVNDTIPIAVAFLETVHAQLGSVAGEVCQLVGDMKISFPADLIRWLSSDAYVLPPLVFQLNNASRCEKIVVNTELLSETGEQASVGSRSYAFKMAAVAAHLKKLAEQNSRAPFYNVDVLRYQIHNAPGGPRVPLSVRSLWKPSPGQLAYRMDCQFHPAFFGRTSGLLKNVKVIVQVSGGVQQVQATPSAEWSEEGSQAVWRLEGVDGGRMMEGAVRAQFVLAEGASAPAPTAVQFACDDVSLSRVQFELSTPGYKLSLLRNKVTTGKYVCEPEVSADL